MAWRRQVFHPVPGEHWDETILFQLTISFVGCCRKPTPLRLCWMQRTTQITRPYGIIVRRVWRTWYSADIERCAAARSALRTSKRHGHFGIHVSYSATGVATYVTVFSPNLISFRISPIFLENCIGSQIDYVTIILAENKPSLNLLLETQFRLECMRKVMCARM